MIYSYIITVVNLAMRAPRTCTQLFIGWLGRGGQPVPAGPRPPLPERRAEVTKGSSPVIPREVVAECPRNGSTKRHQTPTALTPVEN